MHISFTCNNIGTGGAERVICNLANRMTEDGHTVNIICYEKFPDFYYTIKPGVKITELDPMINKRKSRFRRKMAGVVNLGRLFMALKGSDRVISFYTRQNCYSILMSRLRGIPVICSERDHFFLNDGKTNHLMRKLIYPFANGFIHQTQMARQILREKEGVKCRDVVIPNPLWIDEFPERKPVRNRIIAVGRLADQKNYECMLMAFGLVYPKCKNASLFIYGDGFLKESLSNLATSLGIDKAVHFMGVKKDILNAYAEADVFVMSSHGEGYPNALMEALAVGVPSVSCDCPVGGPRDMINNGENGFLVPCNDHEALAKRLLDLVNSEELKKKFSEKAIHIRETNRFEYIYSKYMDFIMSM